MYSALIGLFANHHLKWWLLTSLGLTIAYYDREKGKIENKNGQAIAYIEGNKIEDRYGRMIALIDGQKIINFEGSNFWIE